MASAPPLLLRSVVRLAAGLAVLAAFAFAASGVAHAALAGANPLTTTNRPDLRTIHVLQASDTAMFCFDKTLSNTGFGGAAIAPNQFFLAGYRYDTGVAMTRASLSTSNTSCIAGTVLPTTSGANRDLASYSIGSVGRLAVIANAGGSAAPGNIADSTANLDSNSHNGTTDHTSGPDLQSVGAPDTTNNQILFTFDQTVQSGGSSLAGGVGRFLFYDHNGLAHFGYPIAADSVGDVLVQFCTGVGQPAVSIPAGFRCNQADPLGTAVRAVATRVNDGSQATDDQGANQGCQTPPFGCPAEGNPANQKGAVVEQSGDPATANPVEAVAVPGASGITARPDLTSAAIVQSGGQPTNQVDFTFDQAVTPGTASDFTVTLANGQEIQGDSEATASANTVRVMFNTANLQNFQELAVKASAYAPFPSFAVRGAVTVSGAHLDNTAGGVALGGNAGAFATGYTTGPDFRSATFNTSNGTVILQADQRINPASVSASSNNWTLIANDGTPITATPQSAVVTNNTPFQSQVILTFVPTELQRAVAIQVSGPPSCGNDNSNFSSPAALTFAGGGFSPQGNVCQVIAPTASGAAFRDPYRGRVKVRWHYASREQLAIRRHRGRRR